MQPGPIARVVPSKHVSEKLQTRALVSVTAAVSSGVNASKCLQSLSETTSQPAVARCLVSWMSSSFSVLYGSTVHSNASRNTFPEVYGDSQDSSPTASECFTPVLIGRHLLSTVSAYHDSGGSRVVT